MSLISIARNLTTTQLIQPAMTSERNTLALKVATDSRSYRLCLGVVLRSNPNKILERNPKPHFPQPTNANHRDPCVTTVPYLRDTIDDENKWQIASWLQVIEILHACAVLDYRSPA